MPEEFTYWLICYRFRISCSVDAMLMTCVWKGSLVDWVIENCGTVDCPGEGGLQKLTTMTFATEISETEYHKGKKGL